MQKHDLLAVALGFIRGICFHGCCYFFWTLIMNFLISLTVNIWVSSKYCHNRFCFEELSVLQQFHHLHKYFEQKKQLNMSNSLAIFIASILFSLTGLTFKLYEVPVSQSWETSIGRDFGVSTAIMISRRYFPKVLQVGLWTLGRKRWNVR